MIEDKLTENETIEILIDFLKNENWKIDSFCLDQKRGEDIIASKNGQKMIFEVKGGKSK